MFHKTEDEWISNRRAIRFPESSLLSICALSVIEYGAVFVEPQLISDTYQLERVQCKFLEHTSFRPSIDFNPVPSSPELGHSYSTNDEFIANEDPSSLFLLGLDRPD
ncbi:hypothetical protein QTP88_005128 [Uroleucon formosanum]